MKKIYFIIICLCVFNNVYGQKAEINQMVDSINCYYHSCENQIKYADGDRLCFTFKEKMPDSYTEEKYEELYEKYGFKDANNYKKYFEHKEIVYFYKAKIDSLIPILKEYIIEEIKASGLVAEKRCTINNYENAIEEFRYQNYDWDKYGHIFSGKFCIERIEKEFYKDVNYVFENKNRY